MSETKSKKSDLSKSAAVPKILAQEDWYWTKLEGLQDTTKEWIDDEPVPLSASKSARLIFSGKKALVLIFKTKNFETGQEWTSCRVIEPRKQGGITLAMLASCLAEVFQGSEWNISNPGLQPLQISFEDSSTVVCFPGFDS